MDLLQQCAEGFVRLARYQYNIILGRKGGRVELAITFDLADFHHLAGLHKLRDNERFRSGSRRAIIQEILSGSLTLSQASRSVFYPQMESRLKPLAHLEEILDSGPLVFRYNSRQTRFSAIQADYLLQGDFDGRPVYLFLGRRAETDVQMCRTFFPMVERDYARGLPRYTLLRQEKISIDTGKAVVQFDRLGAGP